MKRITTQLVRGTGLLSRAIGYWGRGYYSHIDLVTPDGMLRGSRSDVIRGITPGYQDRPQNYEKWARRTRYTVEVTDDQYETFWWWSGRQLGKPYDKRGLIDSFVYDRNWRNDGGWWCSEVWAANHEAARIFKIAPEVNSVTPGDCAFVLAGMRAVREEMPCP